MKIERLWQGSAQGSAITIVGTTELDALEARTEELEKERGEIAGALSGQPDTIEGFDCDGEEHSRVATTPERIERLIFECDSLRAWNKQHKSRIEALERARMLAISEWSTWKDVLLSNMTEADWQETMDGLRAPSALAEED